MIAKHILLIDVGDQNPYYYYNKSIFGLLVMRVKTQLDLLSILSCFPASLSTLGFVKGRGFFRSCSGHLNIFFPFAARIGLLYTISGFGGSLMSALFIKSSISVGASGALFGLLGGMLSELLTNWTIYTNKVILESSH